MCPFPPIAQETRTHVPTPQAAHYLTRQPQTLRKWAVYQTGPLQPTRIHGRLLWSMDAIRKLLEGAQ